MIDTREKRIVRTLAKMKDRWEQNIVANKPFIKKDISQLWNDFSCIRGCLVSAGPSLKNSIQEIKTKFISKGQEIVVVDIAAKYCIENGVKPDYIVCAESSQAAVKFLDFDCKVPLICDVVTNPEIVRNWKGDIFFYVTNNPCIDLDNSNSLFGERHKKLSGIRTMLKVGGNVGSVGLAFLLSIRNAMKVYLYGHDFCWKDEFYCGGIHEDLSKKRIDNEKYSGTVYEDIDINGDKVYTNMSLLTFRDWYEDIIDIYPGVIENRTGAGLLKGATPCLRV